MTNIGCCPQSWQTTDDGFRHWTNVDWPFTRTRSHIQLIKCLWDSSEHVKKSSVKIFVALRGEHKALFKSSMSMLKEHQLLEIANEGGLKSMSESKSANLPAFWIKIKAEYPEITTKTMKTAVPIFVLHSQQPKQSYGAHWTWGTHCGWHCLPSGGTVSLQRNRLGVPTGSALLLSGIFTHFGFVIILII